MTFKKWSSLPLVAVILVGFILFFRRMDFFSMNEVRAFVSVVFGFAVSCLLLSFIWITQRKPMTAWGLDGPSITDTPNMNPRGRTYSDESDEFDQRRETLCTISSQLDHPPDYEDALVSSKPIDCDYFHPRKASHGLEKDPIISTGSACSKHPNQHGRNLSVDNPLPLCRTCFDELIYNVVGRKVSTSNSMAQFALNIKKGTNSIEQVLSRSRTSRDQPRNHGSQSAGTVTQDQANTRKPSFCELDVSQLVQCGSPPKYHEISPIFNQTTEDQDIDNHRVNSRRR